MLPYVGRYYYLWEWKSIPINKIDCAVDVDNDAKQNGTTIIMNYDPKQPPFVHLCVRMNHKKKNKPTRMKSEEWFSVKLLFSMWFLGCNMAFHSFSGDKFKYHHLNANWIDGRFIEYAIDQFKLLAGVSTMYITCAVFKAWNSFTSKQSEIGHFKNKY